MSLVKILLRRKLFFSLLLVLISCKEANIHYSVTPIFEDKKLNVNFFYKTNDKGELVLVFENQSMGESNLMNCMKDLKVTPKPKNIQIIKDSSLVKVYGKPNKEYNISYNVVKDYKSPPINRYRYRPIVDSTYFHVLGTKLFMYPLHLFPNQESKIPISIDWNFNNEKAVFHSSFGLNKKQQLFISQDELHNSFFVGGDFRRYKFTYKEKPIYFVTRGNWKSIQDQEILEILKNTIKNQHNFWKDTIQTEFSVSLIPTYEKNSYSIGGSALTNSFISYGSNNIGTTKKGMTWLYNHELMHKWISRTIKIEKEVVHYWFSEGFTDYYAYKLMLKNNLLSTEEFIKELNNKVLIPHYKDKVANTPNSELTFQKYWSNYGTYSKLPYRRGLLYAFLLDNQIKKQSKFSKSLDNLMFDLYHKAKKDSSFRVNETVFLDYLSKYLDKESASKEFEKYILNGEHINFKGKLLEELSMIKQEEAPIIIINKNSQKLLMQLKQ